VQRAALADRLRLNTNVTRAEWTGDGWLITAGEEEVLAEYLVLACGRLAEPRVPNVPGLQSFAGSMFHSARWDHTVAIEGKRVAVVGTGASAIQIVPELARRGAHVTLFQRTPAWIVPRGDSPYSLRVRRHWSRSPRSLARTRRELYEEGEARYASRSGDAAASAAARDEALAHLRSQVADPGLREQLTPTYSFGCKRVLLSDDFYPAISSGTVTLESSALAAVSGGTLVADSGAHYEADVLVLATGFETASQPYAKVVIGESGTSLDDHWSTGMTSVGSTLVPGFPNMFILNGPNASLGHNSAVLMMESQASFASRLIARTEGRVTVSNAAEADYTAEIVERSASTPWVAGGCSNWYVDDRSGRLTLLWPGTVAEFEHRLALLEASLLASRPTPEGVR
jgi:cation diffusion facilitator CzcD-associated flavoprotein CzcO